MEKPTSLSAHRAQKIFRAWPILLVFFLALLTRLYWIHEKEYMYIDDPTSVSLAYNLPGWGKKTFQAGHILTAKELRQQRYGSALCTDRSGYPIDRYANPPQLRVEPCVFRPVFPVHDTPLTHVISWKDHVDDFLPAIGLYESCLRFKRPTGSRIPHGGMAICPLGLLVPASSRTHPPGTFTGGLAISAALLSCGYFNALFFGFSLLCLAVYSFRQHAYKGLGFYPVLGIASLLLCVLLYEGFFNFLHDARATEVADKMQGGDWLSNLRLTVIGLGYITALRILTPVWGTAIILYLVILLVRKPKQPFHSHRLPGAWLFVCAMAWAVIVMWMANWKATRYISPSVPLCLVAVAYYLALGLQRVPKVLAGIFVAAFIAYAWCERPMEYVNRTSDREWPSHAKRILLYGPDHEEKNTLLLLTHFIGDKQEIAIVEHTTDIRHYAAEEDTTVYVYGAKNSPDLQAEPGYKMEKEFNDWMSVYTFNFQ